MFHSSFLVPVHLSGLECVSKTKITYASIQRIYVLVPARETLENKPYKLLYVDDFHMALAFLFKDFFYFEQYSDPADVNRRKAFAELILLTDLQSIQNDFFFRLMMALFTTPFDGAMFFILLINNNIKKIKEILRSGNYCFDASCDKNERVPLLRKMCQINQKC
ncbi:hypothetical protein BpHYR1_037858 [Brachionus plicatilis]|uniref:Uncharacterized protein n=1 Tax=Brachionus plicatilis TaxID=10195 RepID=A0A3M7RR58_BRAPC|nr:hypothetical protein BpHYR1_037858 [Brachionus plicatilis]